MAFERLEKIAHSLLLRMPAETAHYLGKSGMEHRLFAPGPFKTKESRTEIFGVEIDNPLGIAAGFDKNGDIVEHVKSYGFGFIEVGSVTYEGGSGNSKPRLQRAKTHSGEIALWNRTGMNGKPASEVAEKLRGCEKNGFLNFGVNIAKTNDSGIFGQRAIDDMIASYSHLRDLGIYTVLNLSCPNTRETEAREGKTFENPDSLSDLLNEVEAFFGNHSKPLLLKLSPDLDEGAVRKMVSAAGDRVMGYVCCNTLPYHYRGKSGGGSGGIVRDHSMSVVSHVSNAQRTIAKYSPEKVIIGVGGISTGADMHNYYGAGASYFQVFNGFVVGPNAGPKFAHKVLNEFIELKKRPRRPDTEGRDVPSFRKVE